MGMGVIKQHSNAMNFYIIFTQSTNSRVQTAEYPAKLTRQEWEIMHFYIMRYIMQAG